MISETPWGNWQILIFFLPEDRLRESFSLPAVGSSLAPDAGNSKVSRLLYFIYLKAFPDTSVQNIWLAHIFPRPLSAGSLSQTSSPWLTSSLWLVFMNYSSSEGFGRHPSKPPPDQLVPQYQFFLPLHSFYTLRECFSNFFFPEDLCRKARMLLIQAVIDLFVCSFIYIFDCITE